VGAETALGTGVSVLCFYSPLDTHHANECSKQNIIELNEMRLIVCFYDELGLKGVYFLQLNVNNSELTATVKTRFKPVRRRIFVEI
jgi:hypothetical protein